MDDGERLLQSGLAAVSPVEQQTCNVTGVPVAHGISLERSIETRTFYAVSSPGDTL